MASSGRRTILVEGVATELWIERGISPRGSMFGLPTLVGVQGRKLIVLERPARYGSVEEYALLELRELFGTEVEEGAKRWIA